MQEAYEVLKDPEKRAAYDQLGTNWKAGEQFRPPPDWGSGFEFSGGAGRAGGSRRGPGRGWSGAGGEDGAFAEQDFSDFFSSLFGGGTPFGRGGGGAGRDHHARVGTDLEEAYRGTARTLDLRRPAVKPDGTAELRTHTRRVAIPARGTAGQTMR